MSFGDDSSSAKMEGMTFYENAWHWKDPESGVQMIYDEAKKCWAPIDDCSMASTAASGVVEKDGCWTYVDPSSGKQLVYDKATNQWKSSSEQQSDVAVPPTPRANEQLDDFEYQLQQEAIEQSAKEGAGSDKKFYRDPNDNTVYEWDDVQKGWFPKVDSDFLAQYFSSYGSTPLKPPSPVKVVDVAQSSSGSTSQQNEPEEVIPTDPAERKEYLKQKKKEKRREAAERERKRGWFQMDDEHNTSVYVSNLPLDITTVEFEELMGKCGLIARDLLSKKLKLKLYKNPDDTLKGDGLCTYIKRESVELAENLLDDYNLRGFKLKVQRAKFEQKGEFDPTKKGKRLSAKQKKLLKEKQERLFDWRPEKLRGERPKSDNTVILKNCFDVKELAENAAILFDIEEEVKAECSKYGQIRRSVLYDNNPEGVVSVTFASPEEADDCVTMMNYRLFRGKHLRADRWDGTSTYKIVETEEEARQRLSNWQTFLECSTSQPDQPPMSKN